MNLTQVITNVSWFFFYPVIFWSFLIWWSGAKPGPDVFGFYVFFSWFFPHVICGGWVGFLALNWKKMV